MADDLKFNLRIATENAQRELKNTAKAAGELGDKLDDTRTAGQKLADAMKADADRIDAELKESKQTADLLAEALGSEFVAEVEAGGRSVQGMVMELKSLGVTYDDIRGDADAFADAIRRTESSTKSLDSVKGGFRRVGEEADNTRSVVANFAGNAAQELPGVAGAFGPLNMAMGQFAEYGAEGNIQLKNFIAAGAGLGGLSVAMWALGRGAQQAAKRAAELAEAQEDIIRSTDAQILRTWGQMMMAAAIDGKNLTEQVRDLAENNLVGAKVMRDVLAATGDATGAVEAFDVAIREAEAGTSLAEERNRKYETSQTDAATATRDHAEALGSGLAPSLEETKAAAERYEEAQRQVRDRTREAEDATRDARIALYDYLNQYDGVREDIAGDRTWLDLAEQFDDLKTKSEEAWIATAENAADAEQKTRDQQRAVLDTKDAVLNYAENVAKLPREVITRLITMLDQGAYAEVEEQLNIIARNRTMTLSIEAKGGSASGGGPPSNPKKRAHGGPVLPGETYLVGEEGPELLQMGSQSGTVIPNDKMSSWVGGNNAGDSTFDDTVAFNNGGDLPATPASSSVNSGGSQDWSTTANTYVYSPLVGGSEAQFQEFCRWVDRYERRKRGGL